MFKVFSLRQRLHKETELHAILEKAAENSLASPSEYLSLPNEVLVNIFFFFLFYTKHSETFCVKFFILRVDKCLNTIIIIYNYWRYLKQNIDLRFHETKYRLLFAMLLFNFGLLGVIFFFLSPKGSHIQPEQAQELLSNITTLEAAISSLEQQMVSLQYQISQERNERRLADYRLKQQPSQLIHPCSSECKISLVGRGFSLFSSSIILCFYFHSKDYFVRSRQ